MKIVSNASPLIFLAKIEKIELLEKYEIKIPKQVYEEINKGAKIGKEDVQKIESLINGKIIKVEETIINTEIEKQNIGKGEKAVISLAIKDKTNIVLLDERKARRIAKFYKLKPKGTIGILISAWKTAQISKKELKELIQKLVKEGYRINETLLLEILNKIG